MIYNETIKAGLYNSLLVVLERNVAEAKQAIISAKESRDNDTKSSAGDKYETGRAMMQMEMDKSESQLNKALVQINELSKIDLQKKYSKIEHGALVITGQGNYFVSIGMGKIETENEIYYAISLASPIGTALKDKKSGDSFQFQGKDVSIIDVI